MFEGVHDGIYQIRFARIQVAPQQVSSEGRSAVIVEDKKDRDAVRIHCCKPCFPLIQDVRIQGIVDIARLERVFVVIAVPAVAAHRLHIDAICPRAYQFGDKAGLVAAACTVCVARAAVEEIFRVSRPAHEKRSAALIFQPRRVIWVHNKPAQRRARDNDFHRVFPGQSAGVGDGQPRCVNSRNSVLIVNLNPGRIAGAVIVKIPGVINNRTLDVVRPVAIKMDVQRRLPNHRRSVNRSHGRVSVAGRARLYEQFKVLVHARRGAARHEGSGSTERHDQIKAWDRDQGFRSAMAYCGRCVRGCVRPCQCVWVRRAIPIEPPVEPVNAGTFGGLVGPPTIGADVKIIGSTHRRAWQRDGNLRLHVVVEKTLRQ